MNLSQTKRAIEAREWRAVKREKRRFNILLSDYTSVKFGNVYRECRDFYESLNKKYPGKHDLTKTREYRRWKTQLLNGNSSGSSDDETEPASASVRSDDETEQASASLIRSDSNETEPVSASIQSETEPPSASTHNDETEQSILQIAAADLIPTSPEIDIDNIIDGIIQELQQDDDIRDLLNAERNGELVQPQYMDEDEGIGLNVDTELEAIMEPFDYEVEVEGEDW